MTNEKARKRAVRARMQKTGERYAAARSQIAKPEASFTDDLGLSDAAIRRRTGRGWQEWLRVLDAWGAGTRAHREIARHLQQTLGVDGWSAQSITVGYERARGLRGVNETADGYCAYASKTYPVDVVSLSRAFTEVRGRNRWLDPGTLRVRTSQPGRSARFDIGDGPARLHAWFEAKGPSKSTVSLQITRLDGKEAVDREKVLWKKRLAALGDVLRG
ncbi:MAG: hypothetical protein OEW66_05295 [Actinomycetota bacterium]|nr:hypothetical protein [Actinomycetota bacterium]